MNPREFIKHKNFNYAMAAYQAMNSDKTADQIYKEFCNKAILKDYCGCYIDGWYFYSSEELIFFIDNLIEYIKSKRISSEPKGGISFVLSKPNL